MIGPSDYSSEESASRLRREVEDLRRQAGNAESLYAREHLRADGLEGEVESLREREKVLEAWVQRLRERLGEA